MWRQPLPNYLNKNFVQILGEWSDFRMNGAKYFMRNKLQKKGQNKEIVLILNAFNGKAKHIFRISMFCCSLIGNNFRLALVYWDDIWKLGLAKKPWINGYTPMPNFEQICTVLLSKINMKLICFGILYRVPYNLFQGIFDFGGLSC